MYTNEKGKKLFDCEQWLIEEGTVRKAELKLMKKYGVKIGLPYEEQLEAMKKVQLSKKYASITSGDDESPEHSTNEG